MEKVNITKIYRNDKDKNGNAFISKSGRPYSKIAIQTKEYGAQYLSGFCGAWNEHWQEGDQVVIELKKNGQYLNFERVDENKVQNDRIEKKLDEILALLKNPQAEFERSLQTPAPQEEVNVEDIPF